MHSLSGSCGGYRRWTGYAADWSQNYVAATTILSQIVTLVLGSRGAVRGIEYSKYMPLFIQTKNPEH
jgi:hypothetical protein